MARAWGAAVAAAGAVGAAGAVVALRRRGRPGGRAPAADRWLGVTVLATAEQVAPGGELPAPLRELGDRIEVRIQPAPGDKGTELRARPTDGAQPGPLGARLTGTDALAPLRQALREAKALIECGEVVRPDSPSTTHPGPAGRLIGALDRRAQGAGRL